MKTSDNTILITGAASGIGLEIAKLFGKKNNKVIMVDRATAQLETEAAKIPNAVALTVDLMVARDISNLIQVLKLEHRELNVAILNAAAAYDYALYSPAYDVEYAQAEITTNYLANVRLTQALEPLLSSKEEAAFVITTSGLAFAPNLNYPTYSVTKAALHAYAVASRLALKRKGSPIKVFDLLLPLTETPLAKGLNAPKMTAKAVAAWFMKSFAKDELEIRVGATEEIYQLFLKSPEDALLAVNGGM